MAYIATILFLLECIITLSEAATITCPTLSCTVELDSNVWYLHDNSQPTTTLKGQSCSSTRICEFSPTDGQFAWYSEATQAISSGTSSYIQDKEVTAYCNLISATKQSLYPGRNCKGDDQWYSGNCDDGRCKGLEAGEFCAVDSDCDKNLFWKKEIKWPYRARWTSLLGDSEVCTGDNECQTRYFWWYATYTEQAAGTKRCIDKFSASDDQVFGWGSAPSTSTLSDNEYNGLFWASGFAIQNSSDTTMAICKSVTSIKYNGSTLDSPYSCTPTDTSVNCQLVYGTGASDYVETSWKCALYGSNGYWGSIAGTTEFQKYTTAMKIVLEASKCHTLDRDNLRAQKEGWGIGTSNDQWKYAIEKRFNVTYWPYMQHTNPRDWVEAMFDDSYTNLSKDSAYLTLVSTWAVILAAISMTLIII